MATGNPWSITCELGARMTAIMIEISPVIPLAKRIVFQPPIGGVWLMSSAIWNDGGVWRDAGVWTD